MATDSRQKATQVTAVTDAVTSCGYQLRLPQFVYNAVLQPTGPLPRVPVVRILFRGGLGTREYEEALRTRMILASMRTRTHQSRKTGLGLIPASYVLTSRLYISHLRAYMAMKY